MEIAMRKIVARAMSVVFAGCFAAAVAPSASATSTPPADGKSYATAVVITIADDEAAIRAEDVWLEKHYPGYTKIQQALDQDHGRYFDVIKVTPRGSSEPIDVYFDITKAHKALVDMFK